MVSFKSVGRGRGRRCYRRINYSTEARVVRSGEHVSNDATLGDSISAIAFEVVVSVTRAVFYDVQLPAFICVVFFQRPAEL